MLEPEDNTGAGCVCMVTDVAGMNVRCELVNPQLAFAVPSPLFNKYYSGASAIIVEISKRTQWSDHQQNFTMRAGCFQDIVIIHTNMTLY